MTRERTKLELLADGVRLSVGAVARLTATGHPLSVFEYPTTGGITICLPKVGYVNAPFHGPYAERARWTLDANPDSGAFTLIKGDESIPVRPLPLPCYLGMLDSKGRRVDEVAMSHADRVRLSPLAGCAFRCTFCDFHQKDYFFHERVVEALAIATGDTSLPPRHVLVSGGTPNARQSEMLVDLVADLVGMTVLPVDFMYTPRHDTVDWVDRLIDGGIHGLSINLELFGISALKHHAPQKAAIGRDTFSAHIERAVERFGKPGRVRSLLIVGLEPLQDTIDGVRWLCERGCQPALSPFRPAAGTPLETVAPPSLDLLTAAWEETREIAAYHGIAPAPTCVPCQNNCIAFPPEEWDWQLPGLP